MMGVPAKCLLQRVSTVNSRYAAEEFNLKLPLSSPCARYGSDGDRRPASGRDRLEVGLRSFKLFVCQDSRACGGQERSRHARLRYAARWHETELLGLAIRSPLGL